MSNTTVVYLCSILDEQTKAERNIIADSPAATKKVLDVSRAIKNRVHHMYVLSMGRGKQVINKSNHRATVKRLSGLPVLYASYTPIFFLTYLISSFSLICLLFRIRKRVPGESIHIIVYNRQWLYLPALFISKILNIKCYLDLEDSVLIAEARMMKKLSYKLNILLYDYFCSDGSMLVNPGLLEHIKTNRNIVCYGVADKKADIDTHNWSEKTIHFLFGGSLLQETGVSLLINAVKVLNSKYRSYKERIVIDITGYGDMTDELLRLSSEEGQGWINYCGRVTSEQYKLLLKKSHVGLCLKLPSSEMGSTTFPSKTIEIASYGKLLLTTNLPYVSNLFGEDGAYYIYDERGESLAKMMVNIVDKTMASIATARIGQERLLNSCNPESVADDICSLFQC